MSTSDTNTLTTISPGMSWYPSSFLATHYLDSLDLVASFPGGTTRSVLKLYANGDANFAGDIFLEAGAIRSANTNVIQCMDNQDIVSFRRGQMGGDEKLRITAGGTISSAYQATLGLKSRQQTWPDGTVPSAFVTLELENEPRYQESGAGFSDQAVLEVTAGSATDNQIFSIFGKPSSGLTLAVTDGSTAQPAVLRASSVTVTASVNRAVLNLTSGNTTNPTLAAYTTSAGVQSTANLTVGANTLVLTPVGAHAIMKLSAPSGKLAKIQAYVSSVQDDLTVEANTLILVPSSAHAIVKLSASSGKLAKIVAYANNVQDNLAVEANTLGVFPTASADAVLKLSAQSGRFAKIQAYVNNAQDNLTVEANTLILTPLSSADAVLKLSAQAGKLAKIQAYVNSAQDNLTIEANTVLVSSAAATNAILQLSAPGGYGTKIQSMIGGTQSDLIVEANTLQVKASGADAVLYLNAATSYLPKIKASIAGAISNAEFLVNTLTMKPLSGTASTLRLESASGSATLNLYPGTGSPREWNIEARTDDTLALVDVTDSTDIAIFDYDATASGGGLSVAYMTLGSTRPSNGGGRMYFDPATYKLWAYGTSGGGGWKSVTLT